MLKTQICVTRGRNVLKFQPRLFIAGTAVVNMRNTLELWGFSSPFVQEETKYHTPTRARTHTHAHARMHARTYAHTLTQIYMYIDIYYSGDHEQQYFW